MGFRNIYMRTQIKWLPTPVFLPGKSHGQRNLAGSSPWGLKESDRTEWLKHTHTHTHNHTHTSIHTPTYRDPDDSDGAHVSETLNGGKNRSWSHIHLASNLFFTILLTDWVISDNWLGKAYSLGACFLISKPEASI